MEEFKKYLDKSRKITGIYSGVKLYLNEADKEETPKEETPKDEDFKEGTSVDKKTEIDFFINSMKENKIFTNMKFNDVKIYSDYVEFSGEVPINNNVIYWLIQKECTVKFRKPLIFGSVERNQQQSLSYDIEDVFKIIDEINNVIKAIGEYYEGLKQRIPDYVGMDDVETKNP